MKNKVTVVLILTLLIATAILPVSGDENFDKTKLEKHYFVYEQEVTPTTGDDEWPMYKHDHQGTGYSTSTAPEADHLLWSFYMGIHEACASPAIANGKVYITSNNQVFYCFDAGNGNMLWNVSLPGGNPKGSPAVYEGKVYQGAVYNYTYCWNATTGELIWMHEEGYGGTTSPAIYEGKVYIVRRYGDFYCLDAENGTLLWAYDFGTGAECHASPVAYEGKIYVGSGKVERIYCFDAENGSMLWNKSAGGKAWSSPAVVNGTVYIGGGNKLWCLNATTGEEIWFYDFGSLIVSSPSVAYCKVYINIDGTTYCLDADTGEKLWNTTGENGSNYMHHALAVADEKVYTCSWNEGTLICLDADTGELIWDYQVGVSNWGCGSPAVAYGRVYVCEGVHGTIYCFGGNSPPDTPEQPSGPTDVGTNFEYTYNTNTTDPEGDQVQYRFDWDANGSHNYSGWTGLVSSGTKVYMDYVWNSGGTYVVKAQARDELYAISNWSEGLTVVVVENNPPNTPSDPDPPDGANNVDINADLSWSCSDSDGDNLTYNVYFEANDPSPDVLVSENQTESTYDPGTMNNSTHYYWQIIAWDEYAYAEGPVWDFTTTLVPNDPPYLPTDPFPQNGSTNVDIDADLSWIGGDPDPDDRVSYKVFFEANDPDPEFVCITSMTTYDPGTMNYSTTYYWKIVASDNHYAKTEGPVWHFTTEKIPEPDLSCDGSLSWTKIKPGDTVEGSITVKNIGSYGTKLDWEIVDWPKDWGTWMFTSLSGDDLIPEDSPVMINVSVTVPDEKNSMFSGEVKIVNKENSSDFCTIDVHLSTPRYKLFGFIYHLLNWLERFPLLQRLLEWLLG